MGSVKARVTATRTQGQPRPREGHGVRARPGGRRGRASETETVAAPAAHRHPRGERGLAAAVTTPATRRPQKAVERVIGSPGAVPQSCFLPAELWSSGGSLGVAGGRGSALRPAPGSAAGVRRSRTCGALRTAPGLVPAGGASAPCPACRGVSVLLTWEAGVDLIHSTRSRKKSLRNNCERTSHSGHLTTLVADRVVTDS